MNETRGLHYLPDRCEAARGARVSVCVDSAKGLEMLLAACRSVDYKVCSLWLRHIRERRTPSGHRRVTPANWVPCTWPRDIGTLEHFGVFIECNVGGDRCGCETPKEAAALAKLCLEMSDPRCPAVTKHVNLAGVQAYNGSIQHVRGWKSRAAACEAVAAKTRAFAEAVRRGGKVRKHSGEFTVTGAGSGTFAIEGRHGVLDEVQPGSFFFGDVDYGLNEWDEDLVEKFEPATFVLCTVISVSHQRRVAVVDAGLKALSMDSGPPRVFGRADGLSYRPGGDEHGVLEVADGAQMPAVGDKIRLVPGHIDPTVALHKCFQCYRGGAGGAGAGAATFQMPDVESTWAIESGHLVDQPDGFEPPADSAALELRLDTHMRELEADREKLRACEREIVELKASLRRQERARDASAPGRGNR